MTKPIMGIGMTYDSKLKYRIPRQQPPRAANFLE
jgi:hypothetical protein